LVVSISVVSVNKYLRSTGRKHKRRIVSELRSNLFQQQFYALWTVGKRCIRTVYLTFIVIPAFYVKAKWKTLISTKLKSSRKGTSFQ